MLNKDYKEMLQILLKTKSQQVVKKINLMQNICVGIAIPNIYEQPLFSQLLCDFDMFFEVLIVGFRKIDSEVYAPTFLPQLSRLGHKQANGEHILTFPAFG